MQNLVFRSSFGCKSHFVISYRMYCHGPITNPTDPRGMPFVKVRGINPVRRLVAWQKWQVEGGSWSCLVAGCWWITTGSEQVVIRPSQTAPPVAPIIWNKSSISFESWDLPQINTSFRYCSETSCFARFSVIVPIIQILLVWEFCAWPYHFLWGFPTSFPISRLVF